MGGEWGCVKVPVTALGTCRHQEQGFSSVPEELLGLQCLNVGVIRFTILVSFKKDDFYNTVKLPILYLLIKEWGFRSFRVSAEFSVFPCSRIVAARDPPLP